MARLLASIFERNNQWVRAADSVTRNPRALDGVGWDEQLRANYDAIAAEWHAFAGAGGRLPLIEQLLEESQGNEGSWRAGLLIARARPVPPLADRFPRTVEALQVIPGLRYAIWSVLEPGAALPEHEGPNAGVLRYHLTVESNADAAVRVGDTTVPYVAGEGILFDDTATHAAWNHGTTPRVSILCELLTPVPPPAAWLNAATQSMMSMDRRYRLAMQRAAEWDQALNAGLPVGPGR